MTQLTKIKWLYSFLLLFVFMNTNGQDNINPEKKGYNYEKAWSGGIKLRTDGWGITGEYDKIKNYKRSLV